jgi:hypothetical protein
MRRMYARLVAMPSSVADFSASNASGFHFGRKSVQIVDVFTMCAGATLERWKVRGLVLVPWYSS